MQYLVLITNKRILCDKHFIKCESLEEAKRHASNWDYNQYYIQFCEVKYIN